LMMCQRIALLLDTKEMDEWIWLELMGYQQPTNDENPEDWLPEYRLLKTIGMSEGVHSQGLTDTDRMILNYGYKKSKTRQGILFPVQVPCSQLEQSNEELVVRRTIAFDKSLREKPEKLFFGMVEIRDDFTLFLQGTITVPEMRAIASVIRSRVHEYLLSRRNALLLESQIQGILDSTMDLIASKLAILDPNLLREVRNLMEKQQSDSELDWRGVADACRTVIQRFTDMIYLEEMIPVGGSKPGHDKTLNKCRQIAIWALSRIRTKPDDSPEGARIRRIPDYLDGYYETIVRGVEKVKHKDTRKLRKDEVDRVVIYMVLWMADMIQLLSRAEYPWLK